jgi:hypothetical protein
MPHNQLKNLLRRGIIFAIVAAHACLLMVIVAAMTRSPQGVLRFWVGGIIASIAFAALLGAWRAVISSNESYEIAMAATGSRTKARAIWAGQCIALGILLLHFFDIIKFPGDIFPAAVVVFIGLGVWSRLLGEKALRDAVAAHTQQDDPPDNERVANTATQPTRMAAPRRTTPQTSKPAPGGPAIKMASKQPLIMAQPGKSPRTFGRRV